MARISVIVCTHNPSPDYLRRVLDALDTQTLPKEEWDLLLIDNPSDPPWQKRPNCPGTLKADISVKMNLAGTPARYPGITWRSSGLR